MKINEHLPITGKKTIFRLIPSIIRRTERPIAARTNPDVNTRVASQRECFFHIKSLVSQKKSITFAPIFER